MSIFSPAQLFGYLVFAIGVLAFLQKKDTKLKYLLSIESAFYMIHFFLLGNMSACASAAISSVRTFLSLRFHSRILVVFFIALNIGISAMVVQSWIGWLPVIGSCTATIAVFLMTGIPMRATLLSATFFWLANNILSGSIGGTALETMIAIANFSTIVRMVRGRRNAAPAATFPVEPMTPPSPSPTVSTP